MTNLSLITASLIGLAFYSAQGMAKDPWANDPITNNTTENTRTTDNQSIAEPIPTTQQESGLLTTEEGAIEPVSEVQTEIEETPKPTETIETTQHGDVLHMNESAEVVPVRLLDFPRRGMTTDKVENELGRPGEIIPPVGQPPISRWIYDDRTVYFEYSTVLHVVAK